MSMLYLPLPLAFVNTGHAWNDDFIVIRFLASVSGTIGAGHDFIVVLLLASGSGAKGVSFISCCDELADAFS